MVGSKVEERIMGRVRQNIEVRGRNFWTLFDTGSRNTYVNRDVASLLVTSKAETPRRVGLGGAVREANEMAFLAAKVEGHPVEAQAYVLDEIGKDDTGKPIEVLFGALAMQQWGIRPIPDEEKLDMTHYPTEFIEF